MGFTLYDDENNIIYNRPVGHARFNENHDIAVSSEIVEIVFDGTSAGFHGSFIVYDSAGSTRLFHCTNCVSSSSTTELINVYIDNDLDGNFEWQLPLSETAKCQTSCTFRSGELTQNCSSGQERTQNFSPRTPYEPANNSSPQIHELRMRVPGL